MLPSQPIAITIGAVKVNSIDHSAGIYMGPSIQLDLFVSYKRNQGIGEQNGDASPITLSHSYIYDQDYNDSNSVKNSFL